ncbi:MAG: ribbon-helix-helix protein, CopG family [SAR324 cluster bacterium]|nr:ribbon-helix-helix protein, CopG family [SAR324 cluster bacterium]
MYHIDKVLTVRFEKSFLEKIDRIADLNGKDRNEVVLDALRHYVRANAVKEKSDWRDEMTIKPKILVSDEELIAPIDFSF